MVLRTLRRFTACVAAVAAMALAPAAARAETIILVEETGGSFSQSFTLGTLPASFSTGNFNDVKITVNPGFGSVISSQTTTVNAAPVSSGFNPAIGLRIVVTTDGFTTANGGGLASVTNNASASSAVVGGQNQLTSNTQLLTDPAGTPPTGGSLLGAATGVATDVRPGGGISPETTSSITDFPASFAIQQTITVNAINVGSGGVASGSTLGGSASSTVTTEASAVPAPAGAVLALIGLPLIGLRRALRKNKA